MEHFNTNTDENFNDFSENQKYNLAYKRVKRIKGFYIHLTVYIVVNCIIIFANFNLNNIIIFGNGKLLLQHCFGELV